MTLPPILAALRKHKSGVVLITLQIALTLAVVCNAVFIIARRVERVQRPTGMDEHNLFLIQQQFVNAPSGDTVAARDKRYAMVSGDLQILRGLPDVQAVADVSSLPLLQSSNNGAVGLKPDQSNATAFSTFYSVGDQALKTLGLRLIAGRNFTPTEITHGGDGGDSEPPLTIVTKALADKLFPAGDALGKTIYFNGSAKPTTIIGVIARMQTPNVGWGTNYTWNSVLVPELPIDSFTRTAVRAKPGRMRQAMREARAALLAHDPMRLINDNVGGLWGVHSFADVRTAAYRADVGMAILMSVISVILLCVTGAGIVGLTSFWVGQRTKQIGIRRALGATRANIVHYFQLENLFISVIGSVLGAILAVGLNLWLVKQFSMDRMPVWYVLVGVVALLLLGQLAVLAPARRASRVPPVVATRSV
ncbi:MAG TPA: FtsX-like permease family protein [Rhodanobacteraceae bacterium]